MSNEKKRRPLRSELWFNDLSNPEMTAIYIERYLNYGMTLEELQSGKPIIGIAQTGSDLSPCNRHHLELTKRVPRWHSHRWRHPDGNSGSSYSGDGQTSDGHA